MDDGSEVPGPPRDPGAVTPEVEAVQDRWEQVIADMAVTAAEYREQGWAVLELHPGDVAALGPDRAAHWGLELLVPDDEFRDLERWVADGADRFDACEVLRGSAGGVVFLVVATLDVESDRAVLWPAYYDSARATEMLAAAEAAGELRTHVRPLRGEPVVTVTIDDPGLVFPPDWREPTGE